VDTTDLDEEFRRDVANIRMDGPAGKVNFVLAEEPRVNGMPADRSKSQRSLFTLIPTLEEAEANYHASQQGQMPDRLWVDCVLASNVDDTLAPHGRHMLTCFVQYLPYSPRGQGWDALRETLGDRVTELVGQFAPNVPASVVARRVFTPLDLENTFGITEGNIFHGDISLEQMFFMRPLPRWAQYQTPIDIRVVALPGRQAITRRMPCSGICDERTRAIRPFGLVLDADHDGFQDGLCRNALHGLLC
jgi:phytoene dehydrogenase-like protein